MPCLSWSMLEPAVPPITSCFLSARSEEHTSELQSHSDLVCRLLLEKKKENVCLPFKLARRIPLCRCEHTKLVGEFGFADRRVIQASGFYLVSAYRERPYRITESGLH